jgi:hypothetical protein
VIKQIRSDTRPKRIQIKEIHPRLVVAVSRSDCHAALGLHSLAKTLSLCFLLLLLLAAGKATGLVLAALLLEAQTAELVDELGLAVNDLNLRSLVGR